MPNYQFDVSENCNVLILKIKDNILLYSVTKHSQFKSKNTSSHIFRNPKRNIKLHKISEGTQHTNKLQSPILKSLSLVTTIQGQANFGTFIYRKIIGSLANTQCCGIDGIKHNPAFLICTSHFLFFKYTQLQKKQKVP